MIAIVDYGLGNLASVRNAFRAVGAEVTVTTDRAIIEQASGVVLPGVGAASAGIERLRERGLDRVIQDVALAGRPLFGICLGMQLLFDHSDEGEADCLGLISGSVRRLRGGVKVPHIGWNQVRISGAAPLWQNLSPDPYFYFVHSYVCDPRDPAVIAARTEHGEEFCSVVCDGPIWGTQFHPERSGQSGLALLRNFVKQCEPPGDQDPSNLSRFNRKVPPLSSSTK